MGKNFLRFNDSANIFKILISDDFAYGKNEKKEKKDFVCKQFK